MHNGTSLHAHLGTVVCVKGSASFDTAEAKASRWARRAPVVTTPFWINFGMPPRSGP